MNTRTIKGDWNVLNGQVKAAFGKLTDDDLVVAGGNADRLVRAIQKRYDCTRDEADREWNAVAARIGVATTSAVDRVVLPLEEATTPPNDGGSPYDLNRPADTPDEAFAREMAVIDANHARREF